MNDHLGRICLFVILEQVIQYARHDFCASAAVVTSESWTPGMFLIWTFGLYYAFSCGTIKVSLCYSLLLKHFWSAYFWDYDHLHTHYEFFFLHFSKINHYSPMFLFMNLLLFPMARSRKFYQISARAIIDFCLIVSVAEGYSL